MPVRSRETAYPVLGVDIVDYPAPDPTVSRVPSTAPALSPEQEQRFTGIVTEIPLATWHEHLSVRPGDPRDYEPYRRQGREKLPFGAMGESCLALVFDGGLASPVRARQLWDWNDVVDELGFRVTGMSHQPGFVVIRAGRELAAIKAGTEDISVVLTLESASCVGTDIDRLDVLFGIGIRSMGITYSEGNALASGLSDPRDGGLTNFGRAAVHRMNKLGIIVDISHASEQTTFDVCEVSRKPVIASHSGAKSVHPIARNRSDDAIKAIAATGGVIAMSASPYSTVSVAHPVHTLESVMDHFEHCADLVGLEHVGFGFDTHFGDHLAWHQHWAVADDRPRQHPIDFVDGAENPAEGTANAVRWMIAHGYSDEEIRTVCSANVFRVMKECWPW